MKSNGNERISIGLLKFTDLASLRVGIPTPDGFICLPLRVLTTHIGLHPRRIERAIHDLSAAGLITSNQPRQLDEHGEYRGLPAIRRVNKELFGLFGLIKMLKYERAKAVIHRGVVC